MLAASRELQGLIDEHPKLVRAEAEADRSSKLAQASAYLASSGTVAERQAHVDKATIDEQFAAKMAEGLRKSNELAIKAAMARLSALQSVASATREELRLARVGEGA